MKESFKNKNKSDNLRNSQLGVNENDYDTIETAIHSKTDALPNTSYQVSLSLSEEELNTIFSKYTSKLEDINISIKISKFLCLISIISSFILISIKLSNTGKFSWLYLNIPIVISIILLCLIFNLYLYLKILIEKAEKSSRLYMGNNNNNLNECNNNSNIKNGGTIFTYVILFLITICLIIFSLLSTFYLQDFVINQTKDTIYVFLPLFISLLSLLIYIIFISPAFYASNLRIELGLIYINIFAFFVFLILLCLKVNNILLHNKLNGLKFLFVFIPFYLIIGATIVYLILKKTVFNQKKNRVLGNENRNKNVNFVMNSISLVLILIAGIICNLKLDKIIENKNHFVQSILLMFSYIIFTSVEIWDIFTDNNDEKD